MIQWIQLNIQRKRCMGSQRSRATKGWMKARATVTKPETILVRYTRYSPSTYICTCCIYTVMNLKIFVYRVDVGTYVLQIYVRECECWAMMIRGLFGMFVPNLASYKRRLPMTVMGRMRWLYLFPSVCYKRWLRLCGILQHGCTNDGVGLYEMVVSVTTWFL